MNHVGFHNSAVYHRQNRLPEDLRVGDAVYFTAPKVNPSTTRRRNISVIRRIGATVTVAAAVKVPHCVPYMLVNSLIPTGAVLTAERVNVSAKRNSFHASIPASRLAETMLGVSSGSTICQRILACETPSTIAASSISNGICLIEDRSIQIIIGRPKAAYG